MVFIANLPGPETGTCGACSTIRCGAMMRRLCTTWAACNLDDNCAVLLHPLCFQELGAMYSCLMISLKMSRIISFLSSARCSRSSALMQLVSATFPFPETFGEVEIVITLVFLTRALGFIIGDSFSFQGSPKNCAKVFAVPYTFSRGCDFIFFVSHA